MADTQTAPGETEATVLKSISVPVTKAKSTVDIVIADIPDDVYQEALALGLKEFINQIGRAHV